jgi:hypothetical protein
MFESLLWACVNEGLACIASAADLTQARSLKALFVER